MAMTKKEREAFDAVVKKAEILGALRWTNPVNPDVPPPSGIRDYTVGFVIRGTYVEEAWSGGVNNGSGKPPKNGDRNFSASRGERWLYSTKLLALRQLRYNKECEAAEELRRIDLMIAKEEDLFKGETK